MNMSPRNIVLLVLAVVIGLWLGLSYPLFGLILLIPVIGYVVFILMNNKGAAEADDSTAQQARQFTAPAGKAAIYVMRDGFVGGQQGMKVRIDDTLASQFRTGRFVRAEVEPGSHTIVAQMAAQTAGSAVTEAITVGAGECVLLDAKLDMGALQGKIVLKPTRDPAEAREKLRKLKLVEWQAA